MDAGPQRLSTICNLVNTKDHSRQLTLSDKCPNFSRTHCSLLAQYSAFNKEKLGSFPNIVKTFVDSSMSGRWVAGMAAPGTQALLRWRLSWLTSPGLVPAHPTRCSILLQIVHLKPESPWQPPGEHLAKATPASAVTSSPILARPPAPASSLCEASPSVTIGWSGLLGVGEATMGSLSTLQSPASVIALLLSQ